jgi:hypothetical protein
MKIFEGMAHRKPLNFPYLYKKKKKKEVAAPLALDFLSQNQPKLPFSLGQGSCHKGLPTTSLIPLSVIPLPF